MSQKFYVLDVSYEIEAGKPVILIWAIDENGKRVLLKYDSFRPYFYVLPKEGADLEKLKKKISLVSQPKSPILNMEIVEKKYIGRPKKVIKVTTLIPESVRKYREEIKKFEEVEEVLEADIRFAMRFIIDKDVSPSGWIECETESLGTDKRYRVQEVLKIKDEPKRLEKIEKPNVSILAFDIEVYNKSGTPRPERDPIISIAFADEEGVVSKIAEDKNDAPLLWWFRNHILKKDPDILVGYNVNHFDWPYLIERAKFWKIPLDVGRKVGVPPSTGAYGHISVPGRANVDIYDFAKEVYEVKVKTLENIADYFDVMKKEERIIIPGPEIYKYWEDPSKRELLRKYNEEDALSTFLLSKLFLPFGEQLSYLTGLPLDQVMAASVGYRVEWYLMRIAFKNNELVPNRVERKVTQSYRGAIVLKPLRGVFHNVAVLDFSSMYPNIMIKYNVGPDTLVRPGEKVDPNDVYVSPVGHKFRKKPDAFFKKSLVTLLNLRKKIKEEMKELSEDDPKYRLLNERQKAVKVLANAHYGYMGWPHARWYCRECAEAVTAWGRELILKALKIARELGLKVIYGDTDSLFVIYDKEKVKKFIEIIEKELGFEIKIDKIYKTVFFTEAKKRYAGVLENGKIDIVGFEAVRGDWAEIAKEVQETVIDKVLRTGNVDEAIKYVREVISKLKRYEVPLEKLIIWKTLEKSLDEYKAEPPHVVAAKRALRAGYEVKKGDKVGYVIVKGPERLSKRAYPWFMIKDIKDVDVNYYIEHQVIPAAMRILGYFGVSEAKLRGREDGLWKFFKK